MKKSLQNDSTAHEQTTPLTKILFSAWLGKKASQLRLSTAYRTDERVRLMNEIIAGIQVIKMYTWEKPFTKLVETVRKKEMEYIRMTSVIRAILMSCALVLNRGAIFLCILVYVLTGNTLNSAYAFTMISFYKLLDNVLMYFPQAVYQTAEMLSSIKRIESFLLYEEIDVKNDISNGVYDTGGEPFIYLAKVSARWLKSLSENNLEDVTMKVGAGELVAVVGSVGSGKSTLLHVILKELEPRSGSVEINGRVSYSSQEPWLFGGSVRQNITFGRKFDQEKYNEVVRVCSLERDFMLLPHGDRTLAGERGVTLSGGQRARINLARAVYKEADIYVLDDPLSAVDSHVGKRLFEDCITGYLGKKCVVLVTHQLQFLKHVNNIYLMEKGKIRVSGTYDDMKKSGTEFTKLLTDLEDEEEEHRRKSGMLIEKQDNDEDHEVQILGREETGKGSISWHVYQSFIRAGGSTLRVCIVLFGFIVTQTLDSSAEYFVTTWVNVQQWITQNNLTNPNRTRYLGINSSPTLPINLSDYSIAQSHFSRSTSSTPISSPPEDPYRDSWLTPVFTGNDTIIYFSVLVASIICLTFLRSLAFYEWCLKASTKLHNDMFNNIVYSPMRFFNITPSGRILNRFSRDIGAVDEFLPLTLLDTIQVGLTVVAVSIVIGSLSIWIVVPTARVFVIFYYMRVVFLETSRDVKRIESVSANGTFGFWMDFVCIIYIGVVMATMLFIKEESFGGNVGLALTQAMGLTGCFQWGMRQWSELENQMTSVERVKEYADLVPEAEGKVKEPPKLWPEKGNIQFRNMSLRYSPTDPCVLKNLNFEIKEKEKIGIVGRTGAGKSSLIQALFRLADVEGSILIDDIDTKTISLHTLRSKISIIPQEPVLFSGTLRKNLDPFDEYKDEVLWNTLEEVELKSAVYDLPSGLDSKRAEGGSNLSVGQRQLVCLARAVLRNNKVLVLDEATANVDPHTDALIQNTIRRKFAECTVLTIAHRLHTVMDSDKVLVMDAGRATEFDHPHVLLQNENGMFYSLVMQTGKAHAKNLMTIAKEKYKKDHE
ncbi:hypothetical protein JTB14_012370 [Gonioctena quinquepunctata]|nr:hypothetical protein JTB14_012370 [Gonioctena quinquepunctata]